MMRLSRKYLVHSIGWILLFFFWFSIYSFLEPTVFLAAFLSAVCVVFSIITYYTTVHFFVPRFLYKKRYFTLVVSFLIFLLLVGSLYAYAEYFLYETLYAHLDWNYVKLVYNCYIQLFYIAAIGGAIRFFNDKYKTEKNLERIEKENAQNELKFLRAQMNPHLMFNSLNTIYFQIPKENERARNTLLSFSDLLRYQLYECNVDKVSIYKEIRYIKNYIDLQRERKKDLHKFMFDHSGIEQDFQLAPLVIIPFVENAIKYVSNHKDKMNTVDVILTGNKKQFHLSVTNTKDSLCSNEVVNYKGIGLENVKRRLELLYYGKYSLEVQDTESSYSMDLKIEL